MSDTTIPEPEELVMIWTKEPSIHLARLNGHFDTFWHEETAGCTPLTEVTRWISVESINKSENLKDSIPNDLNEMYAELMRGGPAMLMGDRAVQLIERIASLTAELASVRQQAAAYLAEQEQRTKDLYADQNKIIGLLEAERDQLKEMNGRLESWKNTTWKHSEHWRNPETEQIECDCCCSWALDMERLAAERDGLKAENERLKMHRDNAILSEKKDFDRALYALAGARICTPEETYGSNSSWAIGDLCRAVIELKADADRLAEALRWFRSHAQWIPALGKDLAQKADTALALHAGKEAQSQDGGEERQ